MTVARLLVAGLAVLAVGVVVVAVRDAGDRAVEVRPSRDAASPSSSPSPSPSPDTSPTPSPRPSPVDRSRVGPWTVGEPWGTVPGLTMFRGNPTRTYYGAGPVPDDPQVAWRYPDRALCTRESEKLWCGSGWTGQPVVWERPDGVTEAVVGAYDGAVHFVDAATGRPTRPPFQTGHLIKGSVTLDPDGFPLLYVGSRDNRLRVIALDRDRPTELWSLAANPERVWNNDWDGNPAIVDGILYEGGEDSWFYAIELNRTRDADGLVQVAPEVLVEIPGWTPELFERIGDRNVSIEGSVAVFGDRVYFANSGGRVVGLDVSRVREGRAPVVFDTWLGDDVDATLVVDEQGMLYASVELERFLDRAREVGQLVKLDPDAAGDPRVWGVDVPPRPPPGVARDDGGIWSTPALHGDVLYVTTHPGDLLAVDRTTGEVLWREDIGYHEWSSPVVVDQTLLVGLCEAAGLRAYDVRDPASPRRLWDATGIVGGCVESTPAVWKGTVVVGSRDGYIYGFR